MYNVRCKRRFKPSYLRACSYGLCFIVIIHAWKLSHLYYLEITFTLRWISRTGAFAATSAYFYAKIIIRIAQNKLIDIENLIEVTKMEIRKTKAYTVKNILYLC